MTRSASLAGKLLLRLDNIHNALPVAIIFVLSTISWHFSINYISEYGTYEEAFSIFDMVVIAALSLAFYKWAHECSVHRSVQLESFALLMLAPSLSVREISRGVQITDLGIQVGMTRALINHQFSLSIFLLVLGLIINPVLLISIPVVIAWILSYCFGPGVYWKFQYRTVASIAKTISLIMVTLVLVVSVYYKTYYKRPDVPYSFDNDFQQFLFAVIRPTVALFMVFPACICGFTGKPQVFLWALSNCAFVCSIVVYGFSPDSGTLALLFTLLATVRYNHDTSVYAMAMWIHNICYSTSLLSIFHLTDSFRVQISFAWFVLFNLLFTKPGSILPAHWFVRWAVALSYAGLLSSVVEGMLEACSFEDIVGHVLINSIGSIIVYVVWQNWRMFSQTAPPPIESETRDISL